MFDLQSVNNDIREVIEKTERKNEVDLKKERIIAISFLLQFKNAVNLIRWNHFCLKYPEADNKYLGEPLSKQDLENVKQQTKKLSGHINKLCLLLNTTRSEMENELNSLINIE